MREPILVSACLAGLCTDWCGDSAPVPWLRQAMAHGQAIPVCPEQLGDLPTPRAPIERRGTRVVSATGRDVTDAMRLGASRTLAIARGHGCRLAVLKARSPACGTGEIFDGSFSGTLIEGDGVAAEVLRRGDLALLTEETATPDILGTEPLMGDGAAVYSSEKSFDETT